MAKDTAAAFAEVIHPPAPLQMAAHSPTVKA
jgi:hypothetical protein